MPSEVIFKLSQFRQDRFQPFNVVGKSHRLMIRQDTCDRDGFRISRMHRQVTAARAVLATIDRLPGCEVVCLPPIDESIELIVLMQDLNSL